jgi:hypothetical protein
MDKLVLNFHDIGEMSDIVKFSVEGIGLRRKLDSFVGRRCFELFRLSVLIRLNFLLLFAVERPDSDNDLKVLFSDLLGHFSCIMRGEGTCV